MYRYLLRAIIKILRLDLHLMLRMQHAVGLSKRQLKEIAQSSPQFIGARNDMSTSYVNWVLKSLDLSYERVNNPMIYFTHPNASFSINNIIIFKKDPSADFKYNDFAHENTHENLRIGFCVQTQPVVVQYFEGVELQMTRVSESQILKRVKTYG